MHANILIVRSLEADLQRKLRIAAAQRAIHSEDQSRSPRLPHLRSATRRMRFTPAPPVGGAPFGRTPQ